MPAPELVALAGIVLSALIAALGYYGKLRHERRRTTRVALFYLLRMRVNVSALAFASQSFPSALGQSVSLAAQRNGLQIPEDHLRGLAEAAQPSVAAALSQHMLETSAELLDGLRDSLLALAKDDPLLAVRLSANLQLQPSRNPALPAGTTSVDPNARTDQVSQAVREAGYPLTLGLLTASAREVAWACGVFTWLRTVASLVAQDAAMNNQRLLYFLQPVAEALVADAKNRVSTKHQ